MKIFARSKAARTEAWIRLEGTRAKDARAGASTPAADGFDSESM